MTNSYIQTQLNKFNAGLKVDGVIGRISLFWIHGIQSAGSLKIDGKYGPKTHEYVKSILDSRKTNTKHFKQSEFKCRHCGSIGKGIHINLLILLESLRYLDKTPIKIISGYRCQTHNTNVNGAPKSKHRLGEAADIIVESVSPTTIYQLSDIYNPKGGVGYYSNFTHVDIRGHKARW
jgi:uncharacterized protein YcbK (DUF882 family)